MQLGMTKAAVLAVLGAALLGGGAMADDVTTLAENGLANAVIVVAKRAPPPEQHAAAELAKFLKQVTGAAFPVVHRSPLKENPRLLVGGRGRLDVEIIEGDEVSLEATTAFSTGRQANVGKGAGQCPPVLAATALPGPPNADFRHAATNKPGALTASCRRAA